MILVSFLSRHRRALALCAASVLLHVLALWWVLPQIDRVDARAAAPERAPVEVRLLALAAPAEPVPSAAPPPLPKPARKPRRAPVAAAAPPQALNRQALAPEQGSATSSLSSVQFDVPETTVAAALPALDSVAVDAVAAQPAPPPQPAPEGATPAPTRRYKANLPPSARIVLGVERRDAEGALWHGEAVMAWTLKGDRYTMSVEAGIRVLVARVNLVVLESEGSVGENGFAPATMTEKRRGRALTATHFNAREGRITFSASAASVALLPGAQDKATVPLQLAAIARGDSAQLDGGIDILVGEDTDASVYHFVLLGQEQLDTGLGKVATWHLSRPPRAGAYGSRLDIWLAPGMGWYPVQIRNSEANGAVTTQTVNRIIMTETGT